MLESDFRPGTGAPSSADHCDAALAIKREWRRRRVPCPVTRLIDLPLPVRCCASAIEPIAGPETRPFREDDTRAGHRPAVRPHSGTNPWPATMWPTNVVRSSSYTGKRLIRRWAAGRSTDDAVGWQEEPLGHIAGERHAVLAVDTHEVRDESFVNRAPAGGTASGGIGPLVGCRQRTSSTNSTSRQARHRNWSVTRKTVSAGAVGRRHRVLVILACATTLA